MEDFFYKIRGFVKLARNIFLELFWFRNFFIFFIYGGILFNLIAWIVLWQLTKLNHDIIILHYNAYLGIDRILNSDKVFSPELFTIVIGGLVVLLLDIILAATLLYLSGTINEKRSLKQQNSKVELDVNLLGSKLIIVGGFLTQIAIFIYTIAILFVN